MAKKKEKKVQISTLPKKKRRGRPKKGSLRYLLAEIDEILRKDKKNS